MRIASNRRWYVVGAAFATLALGYALRNSFSVFYPAIVEEFGWDRGGTALMFSVAVLVYGVVAPLAGGLTDRFSPRLVIPIGACVVGAGFSLCSLARAQWHFYLLYGFVTAVGLSIMGWTPLSAVVSRWFVQRRGLVFGILGAGFGASLVSASIAQLLIDSIGWQRSYVVLGLVTIGVVVPVCGVCLRRGPSADVDEPRGDSHETPSGQEARIRDSGWTLRRALRSPRFWLLFATVFFLLGVAEQILIVHQVYFYRDMGFTPIRAAVIYTVFGILFVLGNLFSYTSDRFGREKVFVPSCLLAAVAVSLLVFAGSSREWMLWVVAICSGLGLGLAGPVFFAAVADVFQGRHFGSIQGVITLGFALAGAVSPWAAGYLYDSIGTHFVTYLLVGGAFVAAAVFMTLARPRDAQKPA